MPTLKKIALHNLTAAIFRATGAPDAIAAQVADYEKSMAKTLGRIKAVPPGPGFDEVLLPGEPEARFRVRRERDGIPIPEDTWHAVCKVGAELGVNVEAVARDEDILHAGKGEPHGKEAI